MTELSQRGGREGDEKREQLKRSDRQSEVVFMLAVNSQCKVLVTGLWETILFIQDVKDSHQLCFH